MSITIDSILGGRISVKQWKDSYRISSESVILAATIPAINGNIADFGAGVGAISLAFAYNNLEIHAKIDAWEINEQYAKLLHENIHDNKLHKIINIIQSDIFKCEKKYDIIMTNPPYYNDSFPSPNQLKRVAKFAVGFTFQEWLNQCLQCLNPNGVIYFNHDMQNIQAIKAIYNQGDLQILPLSVGDSKPIKKIIGRYSPNKPANFQILPKICLHNEEHVFTEEALAILHHAKVINPWVG